MFTIWECLRQLTIVIYKWRLNITIYKLGHHQLNMANDLDVELEQYEEVTGNLDFSTPVESRSTSMYRVSTTSFQEPIHQLGTISPYLFVA